MWQGGKNKAQYGNIKATHFQFGKTSYSPLECTFLVLYSFFNQVTMGRNQPFSFLWSWGWDHLICDQRMWLHRHISILRSLVIVTFQKILFCHCLCFSPKTVMASSQMLFDWMPTFYTPMNTFWFTYCDSESDKVLG